MIPILWSSDVKLIVRISHFQFLCMKINQIEINILVMGNLTRCLSRKYAKRSLNKNEEIRNLFITLKVKIQETERESSRNHYKINWSPKWLHWLANVLGLIAWVRWVFNWVNRWSWERQCNALNFKWPLFKYWLSDWQLMQIDRKKSHRITNNKKKHSISD